MTKPLSVPTPAELEAAAERLAPLAREHAQAAEAARDLPATVVAALKDAGFHRFYMPRRFGGYGMDWGPHFTVSERLARECGSTGWITSLVFSHIMFVARFAPEGQEEFFARSPDAVLGTGSAGHGAIEAEGDGFRVAGRWSFVSGINHAGGAMVVAREGGKGPISHFVLLLPGEYRVVDAWQSEGLRGTGSHDIVVDGALIPARRVLTMAQFASTEPPGAAIAESYVHRMRPAPYQKSWFMGPLLGTARGALQSYCDQTRARAGRLFGESVAQQVPVQVRAGEAYANIESADLIFRDVIRQLHAHGEGGGDITGEALLRIKRSVTFGSRLCASTADSLASMMGISGYTVGNPVQRLHRDCRTISMHIELNWDHSMSPTGKRLLGIPTGDPLIDGDGGAGSATLGTQV
jgi:3-hydroxy-9,10-secoandrosta-1,3,5(10)-triene-9,17-dione monooxygenase